MLQPGIERSALSDDPRCRLPVVVDESAYRPALVVVEDLPEAGAMAFVGRAADLGVTVGHRLELGPQRRVSPHDWEGYGQWVPDGPHDPHVAARRCPRSAWGPSTGATGRNPTSALGRRADRCGWRWGTPLRRASARRRPTAVTSVNSSCVCGTTSDAR